MGRCLKATLSRVNNLGHAQKNLQAQVEDITDLQDPDFDENPPQNHANDLLEKGFFMLEEDLGSDSEDKIRVYQDQLRSGLTKNIMDTGSFHPISSPNSKMSSIKSMGTTKYCSLLL
jgi:hypothetical protein